MRAVEDAGPYIRKGYETMLNDKRLAAAVVSAAKNGVLKYSQYGERLDLIGEDWALTVRQEYAREKLRETLGVIVKMLGYIPQGSCAEIFKVKDGFAMQEFSPETFGEELAFMTKCSGAADCRTTPVSIGVRRLLQTFSGRIAGLEAAPIAIAGGSDVLPKMSVDGKRVRWEKYNWEFTAKSFRPEEGSASVKLLALWASLEGLSLTEWPAGQAYKENPEQYRIDEEEASDDE